MSATQYSLPALAGAGSSRLRRLLEEGQTPDPAALAGWEYRGVNMPSPLPRLLGIRRFIKGFLPEADGRFLGYNRQVVGADLGLPWTARRQRDGRERYAYFAVQAVQAVLAVQQGAVDSRYPHALLFDYGAPPEPEPGLAARLRDYVVRVVPGSDDLLLGRAFLAVGGRLVPVGWFAIERADPIG